MIGGESDIQTCASEAADAPHSVLFGLSGAIQALTRLRDEQAVATELTRRLGDTLGATTTLWRPGRALVASPSPQAMVHPPGVAACVWMLRELGAQGPGRLVYPEPEVAPIGRALGNVRVLAARAPLGGGGGLFVALRAAHEPPFDAGEREYVEALLSCCGCVWNDLRSAAQLGAASLETVSALARAIEASDPYTSGHSERVAWLARMTGTALELGARELQTLEWAGLLHDVGKIGVPQSILAKPGPLTDDEFARVKEHPILGYNVLKPVSALAPLLDAVLHHHENIDGTGYPEGLAGAGIGLEARIIRVVDTFDAMTSLRSYRSGRSVEFTLATLAHDAGRMTDAQITETFVTELRREIHADPASFRARFPAAAFSEGESNV